MAQSDRIPYKNLVSNSGIRFYECGSTFIRVWFDDDRGYEYNETRPGREHVEGMKRLAEAGRGLATYINQNVRGNYARKL
jgi:hypothetical protein